MDKATHKHCLEGVWMRYTGLAVDKRWKKQCLALDGGGVGGPGAMSVADGQFRLSNER